MPPALSLDSQTLTVHPMANFSPGWSQGASTRFCTNKRGLDPPPAFLVTLATASLNLLGHSLP
jgi:hypothetical protein